MDRVKINMIGGGFQHTVSTNGIEPKFIQWVKNGSAPISIYIDNGLYMTVNPNTKNYGWLCESKTIIPSHYEWCKKNIEILKNKFIKIFTHDVELAKISDIFQLTQCSSKSFISEPDGAIYPKTKLVSMIASNKKRCPAHLFRHEMINKFKGKCDHFGTGFNPIPNKIDGLKDYCFSITMENGTYPNMISEKITDCFMTGTIPIFYGIENIGDFFNIDGIIILNNDFKIEDLSFDLYNSKIKAVEDNFRRAMDMLVSEDYLYLKYIKNEL